MKSFFNTGLTQQQFLDEYWQKKPLLIRQAWDGFEPLLTAEELAGLACDEDIESRLFIHDSDKDQWQLKLGPFEPVDFEQLPPSHWTLLVQDVDKHIPACGHLLKAFDFMPAWRRDDVMISYAEAGGSVGAHVDSYDVFLLQAMGKREWQIGATPVHEPELVEDVPVRLLAEFDADETWVLEPGDMLYLPPQFAHHGVALESCMTYSIGFRAPTQLAVLDELVHSLSELPQAESRYTDPDVQVPTFTNALDAAAIARFKKSIATLLNADDALWAKALGQLLSQTKPHLAELGEALIDEADTPIVIEQRLMAGETLNRNPYLRLIWWEGDKCVICFVGEDSFEAEKAQLSLIQQLDNQETIDINALTWLNAESNAFVLLQHYIAQGVYIWAE
jgi:50S ribosomal protein L16 3-hydroxylase